MRGFVALLAFAAVSCGRAEAPRAVPSLRAPKAHFMRKFVAALSAPPANLMPQSAYAPLLAEGATVRCSDCHAGKGLEALPEIGEDAAGAFRLDREGFMIPLMEKWVSRLNERHRDRLVKEVTCTDCHAADPRDGAAALAPLMASFVKALSDRPRHESAAALWRPLLKPGRTLSCAACHGREMDLGSASTAPVADRQLMIRVMERWVRELNRRAGDRLVKAVGCVDCHEIDPRK